MAEYARASQLDRDDIIDFINYVFSHAHGQHDFKTLLPKSYADDAKDMGAIHYLAKENGRIRACIANRVIDVVIGNDTLKLGMIGNVSVHPYARGEGHMKTLLPMAIDESLSAGVDIMALGGQRQRYGYFGFETTAGALSFTISKTNVRHCLGGVDASRITFRDLSAASEEEITRIRALYEERPFHAIRPLEEYHNIMATWGAKCRLVDKDGSPIGYVWGNLGEIVLVDEADLPVVIRAFFDVFGPKEVSVTAHCFEKERIAFLASICEGSRIASGEMINVLNWKHTLSALLTFKASVMPLLDGCAALNIAGHGIRIAVCGGVPSVEEIPAESADITLSHAAAQQLFFGVESLVLPDTRFKNWLPLPFMIDVPDTY